MLQGNWLLKHNLHETKKETPQEQKPCNSWHRVCSNKKALDFVHLQVRWPYWKAGDDHYSLPKRFLRLDFSWNLNSALWHKDDTNSQQWGATHVAGRSFPPFLQNCLIIDKDKATFVLGFWYEWHDNINPMFEMTRLFHCLEASNLW